MEKLGVQEKRTEKTGSGEATLHLPVPGLTLFLRVGVRLRFVSYLFKFFSGVKRACRVLVWRVSIEIKEGVRRGPL